MSVINVLASLLLYVNFRWNGNSVSLISIVQTTEGSPYGTLEKIKVLYCQDHVRKKTK